jgi:sulfur transfer protein SufE
MELDELAETFELLGDWEERYRYLIELGRELPPLPEADHNDANKVRGCMSQVWLTHRVEPGPPLTLAFQGDSDAHIVKGLIAVLLMLTSGKTHRRGILAPGSGKQHFDEPPQRLLRDGRADQGDGCRDAGAIDINMSAADG